jgi:hypothetical protein
MVKKKLKPAAKDLKKLARDNPKFAEAIQALANTPPISNKEIIARSKKSKKKTP